MGLRASIRVDEVKDYSENLGRKGRSSGHIFLRDGHIEFLRCGGLLHWFGRWRGTRKARDNKETAGWVGNDLALVKREQLSS